MKTFKDYSKERKCFKCKVMKELSEFYPSKLKAGIYMCKSCWKLYLIDYYRRNPDKVRKYKAKMARVYYKQNPEKFKQVRKDWYRTHKRECQDYDNEYKKNRKKTDFKFKLNCNMATNICQALNGRKAGRGWEKLVGYTLDDLIKHLEIKFEPWMNWDNHGKWHIDHIKPKSLFSIDEFKECWALENLQPLEARENLKKYNKYESIKT